MISDQFTTRLKVIRECSPEFSIEKTAKKVAEVLVKFDIPHLICGGYAVQEYGYPRFTCDVDIIVPDVADARMKLAGYGFRSNPGLSMTMTDKASQVEVDLLQAGKSMTLKSLPFPRPTSISNQPQIVSLEQLISLKLSSYLSSPTNRLRDKADVVELIKAGAVPQDLKVDPSVKEEFDLIWRELNG